MLAKTKTIEVFTLDTCLHKKTCDNFHKLLVKMAFYKSMTKLEAMTVYLPTESILNTDQYNRPIGKSELEIIDFIGRYN
jgi:hypothetical protein